MNSKIDKTFYCPYCGHKKDISELDYKTEIGGFSPYQGKLNRPVSHNTYVWQFEKQEVPICTDCMLKIQEASEKSSWIAIGTFIPLVICILYFTLKTSGGFWTFIIPTGLVAAICYIIKWISTKILSAKLGIINGSHSSYISSSQGDDPFNIHNENSESEILRKKWEEKWQKIDEESRKQQEEWNKTHKIVEVDQGCGKVGYIVVPIPLKDNPIEENEEDKKRKELEEGASIDYSDDDFEGYYV